MCMNIYICLYIFIYFKYISIKFMLMRVLKHSKKKFGKTKKLKSELIDDKNIYSKPLIVTKLKQNIYACVRNEKK
jgi:hypothetical protein